MNIKNAKKQIENAITAYLTKNSRGEYIIPIERQRPVFLMGPPGIGKTAIMEQIAAEMNIGILSYSMTHHTRQSALGLPFIEHKTYQGKEYSISEYTMSEIIASIYELMEETGIKEGILFLDEINCVSETLAPVMLQFLQYKVFGKHHIPQGWIIVTAGNPPEYNNSVREFDIVTWDRLKRIDIEPDFDVWKEYAYYAGIHQSIITYLEIMKTDFYTIETTVDGKSFVTARGWEDLSRIIGVYEMNNIEVDKELIQQYLQNKKIAQKFADYYILFNKYKSDYQINLILSGKVSDEIKKRAINSTFDERLSLIGLMLDAVVSEMKQTIIYKKVILELQNTLKNYKIKITDTKKSPYEYMLEIIAEKSSMIAVRKIAGSISENDIVVINSMIDFLANYAKKIISENDIKKAFSAISKEFNTQVQHLKLIVKETTQKMNNILTFTSEVFGNGQEVLILITELTANYYSANFIGEFGGGDYHKYNKELLFYERQITIEQAINSLNLLEENLTEDE